MIPDDSVIGLGGGQTTYRVDEHREIWLPPCAQSYRKGWAAGGAEYSDQGPGLTSLNDQLGMGRWRIRPHNAWWKAATREAVRTQVGYWPVERALIGIRVWLPFWRQRRDASNYMPTGKAILDGLVIWSEDNDYREEDGSYPTRPLGILPDDNDRHVVGPIMLRGWDPGLGANLCRVQVLIRELDSTAVRWWPEEAS